MRSRTNPAIAATPAARSHTGLVKILPPQTLRVFDAPAVLTTTSELAGLHVLLWILIAAWWITPAPQPASPAAGSVVAVK